MMDARTFKFADREFSIEHAHAVRHLVLGAVIAIDRWTFGGNKESLNALKCMGFAEVVQESPLTYRASELLLAMKARHDDKVVTFDTRAHWEKKDISLKACRAANRKFRTLSKAAPLRVFPTWENVLHHGLIEAQSPLFTQSPPVEPGDKFEFSSRGLTDWYVGEFCKTNHYRK